MLDFRMVLGTTGLKIKLYAEKACTLSQSPLINTQVFKVQSIED